MAQSNLPPVKTEKTKRIGRGYGSGKGGHTVGRGTKGHGARTGADKHLWFEGGQLPSVRRYPWQRGKSRLQSLSKVQSVTLMNIVGRGLTEVNPLSLFQAGLIDDAALPVKLIGMAEVKNAITVTDVRVSAGVRERITAAGGSVQTS